MTTSANSIVSELYADIEVFRSALLKVAPFVAGKSSMVTLTGVRLVYVPDIGRLVISGTDLDAGVAIGFPVEVRRHEGFDLVVNAGLLADYIKLVSGAGGSLIIRQIVAGKSTRLYLEFDGYQLNVSALPGDMTPVFPVTTDLDGAGRVLISNDMVSMTDAVEFWRGVRQTMHAASTDDSRPILTTVCVRVDDDGAASVACTDGYRLAVRRRIDFQGVPAGEYLLPARTAKKISSLMATLKDVRLHIGNSRVVSTDKPASRPNVFLWSGVDPVDGSIVNAYAMLMEGKFPDYAAIIPSENAETVAFVIETDAMRQVLKTVTPWSRDDSFRVHLGVAETDLLVSATSAETGDAKAVVPMSDAVGIIGAATLDAVFNGTYLREMLEASGADGVRFSFGTTPAAVLTRPGKFTPVGDDNFMSIVMPMVTTR